MATVQSPDIRAEAKAIIDGLPANATWEDLMYRIYVRQRIEAGIAASNADDVVDADEVRRRFGLSP